ncbi:MAG: hypothetical protein RL324_2252 [Verrucomicrobiota bacterium]|jgi:hypothetical protein
MKVPLHVPGLVVVALLALAAGLRAVELPMTSPFLPPNGAPAAAASALDTGGIELRGVLPTPVGPLFSIYNTSRRMSSFVGLNETGTWGSGAGGTFVVRNYKQVGDQDQVTVEYQGRTSTLMAKKSKVAVPPRAGATLSIAATGSSPALTQAVSLNPTPETEAARLQATVDEIARRRDARAQADVTAAAAPVAPATPAAPVARGTP